MLKRHQAIAGATAFAVAVAIATIGAQVGRGGSAWLTEHGDAQRTSWIRTDGLISVPAMSKPGFALQWKTTLDNANRGSYGLGGGVSAPGVTLFVPMSLVTGSSNNVYAIDSDTGYLVWQRHFEAALPEATDACPGGTISAPTRIVNVAPPAVTAATQPGGGGRATPGYRSVLGQPGEGAPVEVRGGGPGRAGAPPLVDAVPAPRRTQRVARRLVRRLPDSGPSSGAGPRPSGGSAADPANRLFRRARISSGRRFRPPSGVARSRATAFCTSWV
jgi:hypothetical protein